MDTTSLLAEITRPSVLLGKSVNDPQVLEIKRAILDHYHEPDWRHSDEENFVLSKARAFRCLEFLQQRQESTVLCVTHGLNLALIVCCMVFGNEVTSHEYLKFVEHVYTKNTGLTWCTYENGKWRLVTWNDHAHLAE